MKLCCVINGLETGGAEMMLCRLLGRLDRDRFEPVVISLIDKGTLGESIETLAVPVYALGMSRGRLSVRGLWRLTRRLGLLKPDLIQGWMYHGNLAALVGRYLASPRSALLWNIRHSISDLADEGRSTAWAIRGGALLSRSCGKIIYNSAVSARQHEALGYRSDRRVVIPNGFDCEEFKPAPGAGEALRKSLCLAPQDLLIGLIGRHHPVKDHANFFRAGSRLIATHKRVRFVLAGRGVEPANATLTALIRENGLDDRVRLLGERRDMPDLLAGLDIATSSSFGEGFPNVIGEAMACGVPCVVTDVGDSSRLVGDTGCVVPARDPEALARAWGDLIKSGRDRRRRLGEKARQRIVREFSLDAIARQYEVLYQEMAGRKRQGLRAAGA
ncbi:MAG: glycosyltransferase [Candidatus Eisenbacteria sp.]|nr:glycosyltransferase [Candidatus Eisenbacteria bacterium]